MATVITKKGVSLPLHASGNTTFGTDTEIAVTVAKEFAVAGQHFTIRPENGHYVLKDLESGLGTRVNSQAATTVKLVDGDRIQAGKLELVFSDAKSPARSPGQSKASSAAGANLSLPVRKDEAAVEEKPKKRRLIDFGWKKKKTSLVLAAKPKKKPAKPLIKREVIRIQVREDPDNKPVTGLAALFGKRRERKRPELHLNSVAEQPSASRKKKTKVRESLVTKSKKDVSPVPATARKEQKTKVGVSAKDTASALPEKAANESPQPTKMTPHLVASPVEPAVQPLTSSAETVTAPDLATAKAAPPSIETPALPKEAESAAQETTEAPPATTTTEAPQLADATLEATPMAASTPAEMPVMNPPKLPAMATEADAVVPAKDTSAPLPAVAATEPSQTDPTPEQVAPPIAAVPAAGEQSASDSPESVPGLVVQAAKVAPNVELTAVAKEVAQKPKKVKPKRPPLSAVIKRQSERLRAVASAVCGAVATAGRSGASAAAKLALLVKPVLSLPAKAARFGKAIVAGMIGFLGSIAHVLRTTKALFSQSLKSLARFFRAGANAIARSIEALRRAGSSAVSVLGKSRAVVTRIAKAGASGVTGSKDAMVRCCASVAKSLSRIRAGAAERSAAKAAAKVERAAVKVATKTEAPQTEAPQTEAPAPPACAAAPVPDSPATTPATTPEKPAVTLPLWSRPEKVEPRFPALEGWWQPMGAGLVILVVGTVWASQNQHLFEGLFTLYSKTEQPALAVSGADSNDLAYASQKPRDNFPVAENADLTGTWVAVETIDHTASSKENRLIHPGAAFRFEEWGGLKMLAGPGRKDGQPLSDVEALGLHVHFQSTFEIIDTGLAVFRTGDGELLFSADRENGGLALALLAPESHDPLVELFCLPNKKLRRSNYSAATPMQ